MTLVRWAPTRGMKCMHPAFARPVRKEAKRDDESYGTWVPATDIHDTEDDYVFTMEVPGFGKKDVNVEFKENVLYVTGERQEEVEEKPESEGIVFHLSERRGRKFSRSFRLPRNVDGAKIDATLKDGVLVIKVAKPEEKKPVNIPINFS